MAIIVYLTTWIPFWNSLDAVRRIHSDFELSSIIFFAFLALFDGLAHWAEDGSPKERRFAEIGVWCFVVAVICEGVAYPYGQRNDTLSERVIVSLDAKATHASDKAAEAMTDSANAMTEAVTADSKSDDAQTKADAVGKIATGLERENIVLKAKMAPRRVTGAQAKILCSGLHAVRPTTIDMMSSMGTTEPDDFAGDIGRAIVACQIGLSVMLHPSVLITPVPTPFRIGYAPARKQDAEMISAAMVAAKIADKPIDLLLVPDADKDPDALRFFVGPKLSTP